MRSKEIWAALIAGPFLLALAFWGVNEYQQRQVSPDVKESVRAVVFEGGNLPDVGTSENLQTAKSAIKTRRDVELVGLLDWWITISNSHEKDASQAAKWREVEADARQKLATRRLNDTDRALLQQTAESAAEKAKTADEAARREAAEAQNVVRQLKAAVDQ